MLKNLEQWLCGTSYGAFIYVIGFCPHSLKLRFVNAVAKAGAEDASVPSAPLTYLELFSRAKSRNKTIWLIPPEHHWYQGSRPCGCLSIDCIRSVQTTLTRFLSGHIRSLTFSDNSTCFEICPKCTAEQATPDRILACLGLSKQDLVPNPLLTLDFFRVPGSWT
ncbi:hypothetical protein AVEN_208237-1 [Araneus ventricosus]|uniref:Uncharacterized protein n=2 Tax=Araneus ventricosus TaxID=182803 RepID=A0A4Y2NIK6_ARAVE|nr:hypothetical protein AVEN_63039-1 [Araneus ventricosus]GBN39335.1 hypothetical protein AVEN_189264-1 [Araneus ventricosus]GBN39345.1 hypothetical protein AVEN_208237-1 [Araneus ventricosus]